VAQEPARQHAYAYTAKLRDLLRTLAQFGAPPLKLPRVPAPHARAITATPDELARLLSQACPPWLRLYILLYLQCGLRHSEALAVTARTYNPEQHTVTIPIKGGRTRTAQVTADVEALLLAIPPEADPTESYITLLRGRRLNPNSLSPMRTATRCNTPASRAAGTPTWDARQTASATFCRKPPTTLTRSCPASLPATP
jgi:integrase